MTEEQYRTLLLEISLLKERLLRLEGRAPGSAGEETPPPFVSYAEQFSLPAAKEWPKKPSNVLGYLGAACVVFAVVLLIKFSIDSGWLTPIRQMVFATLFGATLALSLLGSSDSDSSYSKELLLLAAHSQMLLAIHRLEEIIGASGVPPLWTAYAFFVLYLGVKRQDATIGKSSFPVIVFAIAYFLLRTFGQLGQTQRISSLLVMGILIYASGYLYRKIKTQQP